MTCSVLTELVLLFSSISLPKNFFMPTKARQDHKKETRLATLNNRINAHSGFDPLAPGLDESPGIPPKRPQPRPTTRHLAATESQGLLNLLVLAAQQAESDDMATCALPSTSGYNNGIVVDLDSGNSIQGGDDNNGKYTL